MKIEPLSILGREIIGARCRLVPLATTHTSHVVEWRNDPSIARWFNVVARFEPVSHERWLASARASGRDFNFVIEGVDGRPAGTVALYDIDWACRSAEFGRLLIGDPTARRTGLAREATALLLAAAARAGIELIRLEVKADNAAATALYASLGFQLVSGSGQNSGLLHMTYRTSDESEEHSTFYPNVP
jgi:RimJ/RimL family protein N-acetyltransferase